MKRLWVGMLLASLPLGLLAQTPDHRPQRDDSVTPAPQGPPADAHVTPMPRDSGVSVAPAPAYDPANPPPVDDTITATPLPPPSPADTQPTIDAPTSPAPASPASASPTSASPGPADTDAAPPNTTAPGDSDAVTARPLPPPSPDDNANGSATELVPNPLDNPNEAPAPGAKPAQPRGQALRGDWLKMGTATLQALDKVNAIEQTLVVKVGDTGHFGSLDIAVRGCYVRAPDVPADATAFLVIRDRRPDAPSFTGWMDHDAPYMSMLAHPLYDVRVTGCSP